MEKRVENIFDYNNYRLLLGSDFAFRSTENTNYSLRGYARDLKISLGYLSEVMNGKKHLSTSKGREIFSNMGYDEDELDFVESLIILNSSDKKGLTQLAQETYDFYRSKTGFRFNSKKDKIMNSVEHFIVFTLAREFTRFEQIYSVANIFGITKEQVQAAINDFIDRNYIEEVEGEYIIRDPNFIITDHENYCKFLGNFAEFFFSHYKKQNINSKNESAASGLILGLDESTLNEVHDLNDYYIMTLFKIANRVLEPTHFAFITNLYLEKKVPTL